MKKTTIVTSTVILCLLLSIIPAVSSAAELYRTLRLGVRGADVSDLQTFLSADSSIYPAGLITGYFGSLTRAAVVRFQSLNRLTADGIVGPNTRAAINAQIGGGAIGGALIQPAPAFTTNVGLTESNSVVTFNVNTDVPTRAVVYYDTSPLNASENLTVNPVTVSVSGTGVQANTNLQTNHNVATLALQPNKVYHSMVVVTDINGMVSVKKVAPFRTNP